MAFPNFKVAISYVVNAAALELQSACKIICSQRHYNFERRKSAEILRGVISSNVNVGDLRLFFKLLLLNINISEFLFPSKFGQSVSEGSLPEKKCW